MPRAVLTPLRQNVGHVLAALALALALALGLALACSGAVSRGDEPLEHALRRRGRVTVACVLEAPLPWLARAELEAGAW